MKSIRKELNKMIIDEAVKFSSSQIVQLVKAFKNVKGNVLPKDHPLIKQVVKLLKQTDKKTLQQLKSANIPYLSDVALDLLNDGTISTSMPYPDAPYPGQHSFDEDEEYEEVEEGGPGSGRPTKKGSKRDIEKRMDKAVSDANAKLDAAEKAMKAKKKKKNEGGPGSGPHSDDEDNPFDREPSDDELKDIEKQFEGKLSEMNEPWFEITYKDSRGRTKTDSMRAKNPKEAKKDFVNLMKGRGFKVLKVVKEGKLSEDYKNSKWEVYVGDDAYGKNRKVVKVAKSKRAATILYNKLIKTDKYFEVGMRAVKEGTLSADVSYSEGRVRVSSDIDADFRGNMVQIISSGGSIGLSKKSFRSLLNLIRTTLGRTYESIVKITEGKRFRQINCYEVC